VSRFALVAPDRLQIREGGGCLSVFGLPFLAAGLLLLLAVVGVVPLGGMADLPIWGRPVIGMMGLAFAAAGAALAFGRSWTTLDVTQRAAIKQWGLLLPMKEQTRPLDEFKAVALGIIQGDSDSSDRFPVMLKGGSGLDLVLCSSTSYAEARTCAAEVARHLRFALEDASTDHAVTVDPQDADRALRERRAQRPPQPLVPHPGDLRSEITQETSGVRIVIPHDRTGTLALVVALIPGVIPLWFAPDLAEFFRRTRTPAPVGWAFLSFLTVLFVVLPGISAFNAWRRSRLGHTTVKASASGIVIEERGAWRTRTLATLDAADILDVDYSTRASVLASTRTAVEHKLAESGHADRQTLSPRLERLAEMAARWAKGRGVTVKTRQGLTTFGRGLGDEEIRYLHSVVRQALMARV
jgi:hypothetical protein